MIATAAFAAGWRSIDDPDEQPPACPGSGQLVGLLVTVRDGMPSACPTCGRLVRVEAGALVTHDPAPPAPETAPTLGL